MGCAPFPRLGTVECLAVPVPRNIVNSRSKWLPLHVRKSRRTPASRDMRAFQNWLRSLLLRTRSESQGRTLAGRSSSLLLCCSVHPRAACHLRHRHFSRSRYWLGRREAEDELSGRLEAGRVHAAPLASCPIDTSAADPDRSPNGEAERRGEITGGERAGEALAAMPAPTAAPSITILQ